MSFHFFALLRWDVINCFAKIHVDKFIAQPSSILLATFLKNSTKFALRHELMDKEETIITALDSAHRRARGAALTPSCLNRGHFSACHEMYISHTKMLPLPETGKIN
ncbi:uncharacterized protein LOC132207874 isoform X2 [Stegostoma tigrinum]|uniref:uncharacterized protein LOC132207874 isoform X2 n=1 Tax=Stegostoma tigrinum TaxID=3053191 RepID=UPI0028704185|nr:uncharacterized protein LOC132207874 isoform X2 [Stegostoma tigrinum]